MKINIIYYCNGIFKILQFISKNCCQFKILNDTFFFHKKSNFFNYNDTTYIFLCFCFLYIKIFKVYDVGCNSDITIIIKKTQIIKEIIY